MAEFSIVERRLQRRDGAGCQCCCTANVALSLPAVSERSACLPACACSSSALSRKYYGYGIAMIAVFAAIHVSINNPFTRNNPTPVEPKEVVVITHGTPKH